jgi:hypothetical protein
VNDLDRPIKLLEELWPYHDSSRHPEAHNICFACRAGQIVGGNPAFFYNVEKVDRAYSK